MLWEGIWSVLCAAGLSAVMLDRVEDATARAGARGSAALAGILIPSLLAHGAEGIPSVSFADPQSPLRTADISIDRQSLLRLTLKHLTGQGHRRIAVLSTTEIGFGSEEGRREMHFARREAGLQNLVCVQLDTKENHGSDEQERRVRDLLSTHQVSALLCCSQPVAEYALHIASAMGLRCPADLSVITCGAGGDDIAAAVRLPWRAVGSIAAHRLIAKLRKPDAQLAGPILVQPQVAQGWSTAGRA